LRRGAGDWPGLRRDFRSRIQATSETIQKKKETRDTDLGESGQLVD